MSRLVSGIYHSIYARHATPKPREDARRFTDDEKHARQVQRELELSIEQANNGSTYFEREYERNALRRELDPDYFREANRKSYAKHRAKRLAAKKAERAADPEKFRERSRAYDAANREKRRAAQEARNATYYAKNRERINAERRAKRAAKSLLVVTPGLARLVTVPHDADD